MVGKAQKLARTGAYQKFLVRKERSVEERNMIKDLENQANEKNKARTEEEIKKFLWKATDMDLRK